MGTKMVPMIARQAVAEPEMEPRKAAKMQMATAMPPGRCPTSRFMKSRRWPMPPLARMRLPARMKKGMASMG